MVSTRWTCRIVGAIVCGVAAASAAGAEQYEAGGPLAGLVLPLMPTQHGEAPGYPGCIAELLRKGEQLTDMGRRYRQWGPQGQAPQRLLYDGSVEHWRAYMFKYMPVRSFFDRQSQLKNFAAPNLQGADSAHIEQYAEPVYWVPRHASPQPTGRFHRPVPVVRIKVGSPMMKLDLGELPQGLYVVRVIGAVETDRLRPFREPLFMRMTVNDGTGQRSPEYRRRLGYCDQFYSVAEFYFHAVARRHYRAELSVDRGSTVDLLVHNVSLDDVLAGTVRRAIKTRTTIAAATPAAKAALAAHKTSGRSAADPLSDEQRLARDAAIWMRFPPINSQGSHLRAGHGGYGSIQGVTAGSDKLDGSRIQQQYGGWVPWDEAQPPQWAADVPAENVWLVNPKLQRIYTLQDARRNRPLPGPYPFGDDGAGLYFPDPGDPAKGAAWTPIGACVHQLHRDYYHQIGRSLGRYRLHGNRDDAHDAAMALVRWAYAFPTLDPSEYLSDTLHDPGAFGRDYSCRRRHTAADFLPHYQMYVQPIMLQYDELFELISSSRQLAESVGRFVPWVKTPQDVVRLIDVYLVQTTAKRIMRYHYHTDPMDVANLAAVVSNRRVTDPWMEWLFRRTFIYPLPVAGIQDVMITGTTREGTEFVGSTYYAQGEGASRVAASLDRYLAAGGDPRYDLSDRRRYPKPAAHAYWRIENVVAGGDFLRIGDVCGPDKVPGHTLRDLRFARHGWRWTRDPRFAFILRHYLGRSDETDRQWVEIVLAAAERSRAPWLELRSRVLPMWAGVLESGLQHDDYRFRRAAYLRLGFGIGHQHSDTFDLQLVAHGLPMTIDGGQRSGYTVPTDRTTRVHNLVQVDGATAYRHSWAKALADHPGVRYLAAEAVPPAEVSLFGRQIALIDVNQGTGSQPLPPAKQRPGSELPTVEATADAYLFDVFRVGGGRQHTYCFHGPINDDFQLNATGMGPPADASQEAEYLARFHLRPELSLAGTAPETLQATWRMALEVPGPGAGEKEMLGRNYRADAPRKFTRLHLLGVEGARAMRGESVCRQWNYHFTNLMVRKSAAGDKPLDEPFVGLIEPYVGQPVIDARRELAVVDNQQDSRRAVAVEVRTGGGRTGGGRTDVCFADGRPGRLRRVPQVKLSVRGEFAFCSRDADGLRQATLVGGTLLETPDVRLVPAAARRQGKVIRVDYPARKLWLDAPWPTRRTPCVLEVGMPGHMTTYTAVSVEGNGPDGKTEITLQRGADYFRSQITHVDAAAATVTATLRPLIEYIDHNRSGWVASDDAAETFWRAEYLGDGRFHLDGPPIDEASFGDEGVLRLWEYGVGDGVRQSTSVSLRRLQPGSFELITDVPVTVTLPGRAITVQIDGKDIVYRVSRNRDGWFVQPSDRPIRFNAAP